MLPCHTMKWATESRSVRWPQSSAKLLGLKSPLKGRRRRSRIQPWSVVEDLANRAFSPGLPPSFLNNGCAFRTTTSLGIPENYIFPEMVYCNKRSSAVGRTMELTDAVKALLLNTFKALKGQCAPDIYGADSSSLGPRRPAAGRM